MKTYQEIIQELFNLIERYVFEGITLPEENIQIAKLKEDFYIQLATEK